MGKHSEEQQYENDLSSRSLLKNDRLEEERTFSDGESTVLGQIESNHDKYLPQSSQRLFGRKLVVSLIVFLSILLTSAIVLLAWLIAHPRTIHIDYLNHNLDTSIPTEHDTSHFPKVIGITSCGTKAREAIAAGCHFDTFSFGWTPPECTDMQLYNENIALLNNLTDGAYAFYTRNSDPIPLSAIEEYGSGTSPPGAYVTDKHEIHTTWQHYLVACAYAWQKVQRAAARGWPLEEWSASYKLASQCGPDMLLSGWDERQGDSIKSHLKPWFPTCGLEAEQIRAEVETALQ